MKKCFIITPIGGENTDTRRAAEGVIDTVIAPVLESSEFGFKVTVAHRMSNPGSINRQVITSIIEDELVVVNLTGLNPNVMYELGIRHALRKPVIQICEKGTRLPFDIIDERTIFYSNDMYGVIELQKSFKDMVIKAIMDKFPDNPIYRVLDNESITFNKLESLEKNLVSRLDSIQKVIENKSKNRRTSRVENEKLITKTFHINICPERGISERNILDFIHKLELIGKATYHSLSPDSLCNGYFWLTFNYTSKYITHSSYFRQIFQDNKAPFTVLSIEEL